MTDVSETRTYAMLAKPVSSACNLRCAYCYYTGKDHVLNIGTARMSDTVLEAYMHKTYGLPDECLECPHIRLCFGGCPKDRLWGNRNYLCEGYQIFFRHVKACNQPFCCQSPDVPI